MDKAWIYTKMSNKFAKLCDKLPKISGNWSEENRRKRLVVAF